MLECAERRCWVVQNGAAGWCRTALLDGAERRCWWCRTALLGGAELSCWVVQNCAAGGAEWRCWWCRTALLVVQNGAAGGAERRCWVVLLVNATGWCCWKSASSHTLPWNVFGLVHHCYLCLCDLCNPLDNQYVL